MNTMTVSSTTISTSTTEAQSKLYICLITLLLASVGIKYDNSDTNPFRESRATILVFLTATFYHAIAITTARTSRTIAILFHVSGVIACDTLLWILVSDLWWYIMINVHMLLVKLIFNYQGISELVIVCYREIFQPEKTCSAIDQEDLDTTDHMEDLEAQEGIDSQVTEIKGN